MILLKLLRLTLKSVCLFSSLALLQVLETRSNVLESSIPAPFVHISNTYPILGVPSGEEGGGPGVGCWHGRKWMVGRVEVRLRLKIIMGTSAGTNLNNLRIKPVRH